MKRSATSSTPRATSCGKCRRRSQKKVPETDAIFEQIHKVNADADVSEHDLRLSIDCKGAVKIGEFSRGGTSRVRVKALDHDFKADAVLIPVGILVPQYDEVFIDFVPTPATSDAIVDAVESFWRDNGKRYGRIDRLVIDLDNGPENHSRRTRFVQRMVEFVDAHDIQVRLAYYPPYHSKYNPVERVWGALENAWNGDLLDTIPAALRHAQSMKWNGNHPVVRFIDRIYEKGIRLGKAAMQALEERLERLPGLEKWFVDIAPVPA